MDKDYYFTEKLLDCFLSGTIPIYWGCPSIGDFFNTKGMIIFDDLLELKDKLKMCTKEYYENNRQPIEQYFYDVQKEYNLEMGPESLLSYYKNYCC